MADLKENCLNCGELCLSVSTETMKHHLEKPWLWKNSNEDYYFCTNQGCETIYFSLNGTSIPQSEVRTLVGVKLATPDAMVCYCFGVSHEYASNLDAKDYVIAQTKAGQCACKVRNPSGRCCLKDFS